MSTRDGGALRSLDPETATAVTSKRTSIRRPSARSTSGLSAQTSRSTRAVIVAASVHGHSTTKQPPPTR